MTSGLDSSASAMHELPVKPTLGSRFPLLRQSCVFRPPKETAACHTPSCAWIDNLISMCFSFFIWKKWKQSPFCGILAPWRLCSLWHRSTPNMLSVRMVMRLLHVVGFLLPNRPLPYLKKNHFEVRFHWAQWWQCPHKHRCTETLVWGLWPNLYLRHQAAASTSLPSPATPSVIPWGKLREPSLRILEALQGSLQDCMNLNNSWELCLQLTRTREIA